MGAPTGQRASAPPSTRVMAADASVAAATDNGAPTPTVELTVKSIDCGTCFELTANGFGGTPPYSYEWDDGSISNSRLLCLQSRESAVSVIAVDAAGSRSIAGVLTLQPTTENTDCSEDLTPALLCLRNRSFEGTAAINTGQSFDATPWSDCVDATTAAAAGMNLTTNTPDIASDALDPVTGIAPPPTDGITYLAMTAGEQASQPLCEVLPAHATTSLRLDAMRFDLVGPELYLQIWGSDSSSCTRRQLLWTSPALQTTWQNYCVTLDANDAIDQLTLRADAPMPVPMLMTTYLAVDNIVPVKSCTSTVSP